MKKKNIILLIIAIVLFILLGTTMAYFGWSSSLENKDQLVDVTVSGGTGSCDKLEDNEKLLYPTSTREKGRILKIKAKQQMAANATITWNLVVNSINESTLSTTGLKHKSFKYELVNDTTLVSYGTGSFENVTNGTTITLSTDKETLDYNTEYTFILYLWIDGTIGNNPLDMANQPYNFDLNCNITGASTKITPADTYQLTNGDGTTYTPAYTGSGTKTVRSTAELSKFKEVRVDNTVVLPSNYTLSEGSTIVTFKESYLKTLSAGDHSLKIVSNDGLTSGVLTVKKTTAAEYITNLYKNAVKETHTINNIEYNYAPSVFLMNDRLGGTTTSLDDGNIRYYSAYDHLKGDPDNYIYFNCSDYSNQSSSTCETWRIIGVFDGKLKIMRNKSIGSLAWDQDKNIDSSKTTYDNDWNTASLKVLLNEKYYNGNTAGIVTYYSGSKGTTATQLNMGNIGIKNDTTRNMIAEATWNIGELSTIDIYQDEAYGFEKKATWKGKIALISPSDFGYAAHFSYNTTLEDTESRIDHYYYYNWIFYLSSFGSDNYFSLLNSYKAEEIASAIEELYGTLAISDVSDESEIFPTLYLNTNLSIGSGDGTSSNPYKLST